mgnify:CR=1 FL=1
MGSEFNLGQNYLNSEEDPGAKPIPKPFPAKGITLPNKAEYSPSSTPCYQFKTISLKYSDDRTLYAIARCKFNFGGLKKPRSSRIAIPACPTPGEQHH